MRNLELTAKDVVITGNVPEDIGLRLEIGDLSQPSLILYNNKMRYAYVRVRQLPHTMTTIPSSEFEKYIAINYRDFGEAPPGLFFRTFDLMSGKDKVTATLVGSGLESNEELPLKMNAVQLGYFPIYQKWGRFLITCQAPSFSDFKQSINGEMWALPWVFTIADYYVMPILDTVISKISGPEGTARSSRQIRNEFYLKFAKEFWDIVYNLIMTPLTSTDPYVQLIDFIVGKLFSLIDSPKVKDWFLDKLGNLGLGTLMDLLPLTKYWKSIIEFCNFVQQISDMNCPSTCQFMVELTPRLRPTFRFPSEDARIYIPMGRRAECPVEVTLPDGKIFAFSTLSALRVQYPALPSQGTFQESFTADVEAVLPDERGYRFSNIVDISDGKPSLLPGKLTISSSQTAGYPIVIIRPVSVSAQAVNPGSSPMPFEFSNGFGAFVKSVSEGIEEITLNFEMNPDVWPAAISRIANSKVIVHATSGNVRLEWSGIGEVSSGQSFNLPLKLIFKSWDNHDYSYLDFMGKFSAIVDFDSNLQGLTLTRIFFPSTENLPGGPYILPFKLELRIADVGSNGKPLVELNPSRQLKAASKARTITFENGFLKMGFALQPGEVKIIAKYLPVDPSEEDKNLQLVEEINLNINQGVPKIKVQQTTIEFEDNDKAGATVTVELPDKDSFGTDNKLQAGIEMLHKKMTLSSIVYRPYDDEPPMSPVDLVFTLENTCGAIFNSDSTTHVMNASKTYVGTIKDFIKASSQGDGNLVIEGKIKSDSRAKLSDPKPVIIPVKIAPPAKAILEGIVPGNQPFEALINLSDGSSLKIWKYNSILLRFRVENHSDKTTERVFVNGSAYPGAVMKDKKGKMANFEILVMNLKEGTYRIAIEAEKVTNFGKPLGQTFNIECLRPVVSVNEVPPRHTGNKKQTFSAKLEYTYNYRLVIKSSSRTIVDKSENCSSSSTYSGQQGSFNIYERFELDNGDNTILLTVSNAFVTYNPVDTIVSGHRPEFYDLSVNGKAINTAGKVDVDSESVSIIGRIMYSTQLTANNNPVPVNNDGTFSYKTNISGDGVHNIVLKANNSFGESTVTLNVNLLPITWVYSFVMDYERTNFEQQIQVIERDPRISTGITWDTGKCTGFSKQYIVSFPEKNAPLLNSIFPSFTIKCFQWNNEKQDYTPEGGWFYDSILGRASRFRGTRELEAYQMICIAHPTRTQVITPAPGVSPGNGLVAYISANINTNQDEWVTIVYSKGGRIL